MPSSPKLTLSDPEPTWEGGGADCEAALAEGSHNQGPSTSREFQTGGSRAPRLGTVPCRKYIDKGNLRRSSPAKPELLERQLRIASRANGTARISPEIRGGFFVLHSGRRVLRRDRTFLDVADDLLREVSPIRLPRALLRKPEGAVGGVRTMCSRWLERADDPRD